MLVPLSLMVPVITMANFQLPNDVIAAIPIRVINTSGAVVPAPSGDVFVAVSSDPTKMAASIGKMPAGPIAGAVALILPPLVKAAPGLTATITDTAGLTSYSLTVDIVDLTPQAISLDMLNAIMTPQPIPTKAS